MAALALSSTFDASNASRGATASPNGTESDPGSDGWSDSEDEGPEPVEPAVSPTSVALPTWSRKELGALKCQLGLENVIQDQGGLVVYRCEPADKKYPTLTGLSSLRQFEHVHVAIMVFNSDEHVTMKTPDMKNKYITYVEYMDGIIVNAKNTKSLRFKKKCQNKGGGESGFELGKGYISHTNGATPLFVFVATPFDHVYLKNKSIRSEPFRIQSKRQERFLEPKQKRRRTKNDVRKYDTDIGNAKSTFAMLETELRRAQIVHRAMNRFFDELRNYADDIVDDTTRYSLQFALRCSEESETASM
jgi:hypothetical protein